nr:pyrin-like isoform X2 [Chrysemys picta bellii]
MGGQIKTVNLPSEPSPVSQKGRGQDFSWMKGEGGKSLFHFLLGTLCSLPVASGQRASLEKTPRDHLIDTISELGESDLKMFKDKLNNFQPKEGYNHIKWSQLEKAEAVEITHLLVSYYDDDYGVEVAGKVLDAMDKKNLARKLSEAAGKGILLFLLLDRNSDSNAAVSQPGRRDP